MHQWVRALEELRTTRKISKNQLQERGIMTRSQYNTMLKAKKGPRIDVLERLLDGFGVSWHQWADVYERAGLAPMKTVGAYHPKPPPRQKKAGSS